MRYEILKPPAPIDPRKLLCTSWEALHQHAPALANHMSEREALELVRQMMPDVAAMPIPLTIGSGTVWVLGFCEDARKVYTAESVIPFVLFVRAIADTERDRKLIAKHGHFDRTLWRVPIAKPEVTTARVHPIEIRTTDLETPLYTDALVGRTRDGRLVITFQIGGGEVSVAFEDSALELTPKAMDPLSDPSATVKRDAIGASWDPNPIPY